MPSVRPSRPALLAGTLLLAAASALLAAAPASAHEELVSTSPADGAVLDAVPAEVTLTFGEEVESLGAAVVVTDSSGARIGDGAPVVDGVTVTQALLPDAAAGAVTVAYRIVSGDGHPVSGTVAFTLELPDPTPSATETMPSAEPSASSAAPSASATSAEPGSAQPSASAASTSGPAGLPLGAVAGGAVLIVGVGAAVALGLRARGGSSS